MAWIKQVSQVGCSA